MEHQNCGHELATVYSARSVELGQAVSGEWIEKNVFSSGCSCPNCHELLSDEEVDELNIPMEYR